MKISNPITDHGSLLGLTDDDHTQYVRKAGSTSTGDQTFANDKGIKGTDTVAAVFDVIKLDLNNLMMIGSQSKATYLQNNGTLSDRRSTGNRNIWSEHTKISVVKAADETVNNSAVLQNDDSLTFPIAANEKWAFIASFKHVSTAVADIKFSWSVPAGCAVEGMSIGDMESAGTPDINLVTPLVVGGSGSNNRVTYLGQIINGATAGTVVVQWAQNTAEVSDTKVLQGSMLLAWKVS